jgi:putative tricarboxylic transport membrane protein
MDTTLIIQILAAVFIATAIYIFIGFIPGTDETSVLLPVTLVIVLAQSIQWSSWHSSFQPS